MDKIEWDGAQGETWAQEWRRTDRSFAALTEKLLARTRNLRFGTVLDIGCGAGELALALARGRPKIGVVGIDVSPPLVAAARERGRNLENVAFECGDAQRWRPDSGLAPQLLVSRHGVMFFEDPTAAFANLAGLADKGAHLLFSCFRAPSANPFFTEVMALLPDAPPHPPPGVPGPFGFADRELVAGILANAGWEGIALDAFDFPMIVGAGEDPVGDAVDYFTKIGPAARLVADMSPPDSERFGDRLRALAARYLADGVIALPAASWIVSARKV